MDTAEPAGWQGKARLSLQNASFTIQRLDHTFMGALVFKEKSLLDEAHPRYCVQPASGLSDLPLVQLREDTPGTEHVVHFNNAGASLPPNPVLLAVEQYLKAEATIGG